MRSQNALNHWRKRIAENLHHNIFTPRNSTLERLGQKVARKRQRTIGSLSQPIKCVLSIHKTKSQLRTLGPQPRMARLDKIPPCLQLEVQQASIVIGGFPLGLQVISLLFIMMSGLTIIKELRKNEYRPGHLHEVYRS